MGPYCGPWLFPDRLYTSDDMQPPDIFEWKKEELYICVNILETASEVVVGCFL